MRLYNRCQATRLKKLTIQVQNETIQNMDNQVDQKRSPTESVIETKTNISFPFSKYLPIIIVALIAGIVGSAGTYFILSSKTNPQPVVSKITPPTATSPTPDPIANWKTYTSTKLSDNSLKPYTISYPESWTINIKRSNVSDQLILTKENYSITIYQAAYGGNGCIFEGQVPEGPYSDLRDREYTQIQSGIGTLRRGEFSSQSGIESDMIKLEFCGSRDVKNYQTPIIIGTINYKIPKDYSESTLVEMDNIVKTLIEAK